jgi:hypothetical protein
MSRRLLRLVSSVCMVAYALTNTHVNLAWSQYVQAKHAATNHTSADDSKPGCKHCCSHDKPGTSDSEQQQSPKPCSDCPEGPDCPCCPNGDHSCPIPGGCSMCSVAKASCLTETPVTQPISAPIGDCTVEHAIAYVPPAHASLVRPPRA